MVLDLVHCVAVRGERRTPLTTKEVALLRYLAERPGQTVCRDQILVDVWGYARPVRTRAVDNVVRRLRQKLGDDPSQPRILFTVYGEGYRLEIEQEAPLSNNSEAAQPPAVPAPAPAPRPALTSSFVGRDQERTRLRELVDRAHAVQILGPGGAGKTRLATALLQELTGTDRRGVFCDLSSATSRAEVIHMLVASLDGWLDEAEDASLTRVLYRAARGLGEAVLVLDNAEQVLQPVADLVLELRETAPRLRMIVTSRCVLPLHGLPTLRLGPMRPEDGVQLLRERAGDPPAWSDEDLHRLVALLDGQPLALELAAPRCHLLGPDALLQRARTSLTALGRAPHAPARHRALAACIQASWDLLDPHAQDALSQLTVFRGGFTADLAEAVVRTAAPHGDVLDHLQTLVGASLLSRRRPDRLELHHAVRLFAAARLHDDGVFQRHARAMADRACALVDRVRGEAAGEALSSLGQERENLEVALQRASDARDRAWLRLGLDAWLAARGALPTRRVLMRDACADLPDDDELIARIWITRSRVLSMGHAPEAMAEAADHALRHAPDAGDLRAMALQARAMVDWHHGDVQAADGWLRQAADTARSLAVQLDVQCDRQYIGALDEGATHALGRRIRAAGIGPARVRFAIARGAELRNRGEPLAARMTYLDGLTAAREIGWRVHEHGLHSMMGDLLLGLGQAAAAREHLERCLHGAPLGIAAILIAAHGTLGALELEEGRTELALHHLDAAMELIGEATWYPWAAIVFAFRAVARAMAGSIAEARSDLEQGWRCLDGRPDADQRARSVTALHLAQDAVHALDPARPAGPQNAASNADESADDADLRMLVALRRRARHSLHEARATA